jgi:hypothetical protein
MLRRISGPHTSCAVADGRPDPALGAGLEGSEPLMSDIDSPGPMDMPGAIDISELPRVDEGCCVAGSLFVAVEQPDRMSRPANTPVAQLRRLMSSPVPGHNWYSSATKALECSCRLGRQVRGDTAYARIGAAGVVTAEFEARG